jgi:hypothetical protein
VHSDHVLVGTHALKYLPFMLCSLPDLKCENFFTSLLPFRF